jgi:hypothetical protein
VISVALSLGEEDECLPITRATVGETVALPLNLTWGDILPIAGDDLRDDEAFASGFGGEGLRDGGEFGEVGPNLDEG